MQYVLCPLKMLGAHMGSKSTVRAKPSYHPQRMVGTTCTRLCDLKSNTHFYFFKPFKYPNENDGVRGGKRV